MQRPSVKKHCIAPGLRYLLPVLAASLCLRVLIPAGFMPGNLLAGDFVELCPQGLPDSVVYRLHAGHGEPGPVVDTDGQCPIGNALASTAPPPADALPGLPRASARLVIPSPRALRPAPINRGYQPRAPPVFSRS